MIPHLHNHSVLKGVLLLFISAACAIVLAAPPEIDDAGLSVRERWSRLSQEERTTFRERFDAYQRMSQGEQRVMAERAKNLSRMEQRVLRGLTSEEREQLLSHDPETRRTLLGELVEDRLRERGRRMHAKLPEEWRERLENASPQERRQFFVEFTVQHRPRMSIVAVERLGRLLEMEPENIDDMKRLPDAERLVRITELRRELDSRSIEETGLLSGVNADRWAEIQKLGAEDFFREVQHLRHEHTLQRRRREFLTDATLPERRCAAAIEIQQAWRPAPSERLELSDLPPRERRATISARRREWVQSILAEYHAFPPPRLDEFERATDAEFYRYIRRFLAEAGTTRERTYPGRWKSSGKDRPGAGHEDPRRPR